MASQSRPGEERHEAKRFCGRSLNDFPNLDPELVTHYCDFIDQSDIHRPKGIFEEFYHLGGFCRTDADHTFNHLFIEKSCQRRASGSDTTNYFGSVVSAPIRIARIDSLRREGQVKILPDLKAGRPEIGEQDFVRRPRIGGAFESHKHFSMKAFAYLGRSISDVLDVRIASLPQRGWNTNADCVNLLEDLVVGCRREFAGRNEFGQRRLWDILNIGAAGEYVVDTHFVDIDTPDLEPCLGELHRKRQSHISKAYNANLSRTIQDLFTK